MATELSVQPHTPAIDLEYTIGDFIPGRYRDSAYLYDAVEDALLDLATEVRGGRVLDVACGTGKQAMRMAGRGCRAVGAEPSMEMINLGRWVHPESGAVMVRCIAETLPFADASFDRVVCQGSLDHFADPYAFMGEAARVTKPHGRIVIALANFDSVSCRFGRVVHLLKTLLRRPRAAPRLYWETPEDHNVRGDLPFVRSLGREGLVLDRCFGVSLLWLAAGYGEALDALPERAARAVWRALDRAARDRPRHADMIVSVWRKPDAVP